MAKSQTVPKHLKPDSRAFFAQMVRDYGITDAAGTGYLTRACECLDRIAAAQIAIEQHGEIMLNAKGVAVLNPACKLEKESRDGFLASMRMMRIDVAPPSGAGPGRPPGPFNRSR